MSSRVKYGQRRVIVTPEALEAWLVNSNIVRTGLPADARFVRLYPRDDGRGYTLVFESIQWDELEEGEEIPKLAVEIERVEEVEHGE